MSVLRRLQRSLRNKVSQPDYAGLTNVLFHGRSEGLVVNTNNDYGIVDSSGNITTLKSVAPHATGVTFTSNGTAPTLTSGRIRFPGGGRLRCTNASAFDTMHHRASGITDLKATVHAVVVFEDNDNPNANCGLFGNNGNSSANKGICGFYDDRSTVDYNNGFRFLCTRGSTGSYISLAQNTNVLTPNRLLDFWVQVDKSKPVDQQVEIIINGFIFVISNQVDSTASAAAATYAMEIGGCGNGATTASPMELLEITFMDGVVADEFRQQFITARMYKYGIPPFPLSVDGIQISSDWDLFDSLGDSTYKLTTHLVQKPSDSDHIVSLTAEGVRHLADSTKHIIRRTSLDKGQTWATKTVFYNPSGADSIQDPGCGYDASGRGHVVTDVWNVTVEGTSPSTPGTLRHLMSDDDFETIAHDILITLPSDSLTHSKVYGTIEENDGVLMVPLYRTDFALGGDNTRVYVLRITDYDTASPSYSFVLVHTGAIVPTSYRNEGALIFLSSTVGILVVRDEGTGEFRQYGTTNNGTSWVDQGALTLGETLTLAAPPRLKKFQIAGTDVIALYYCDRALDTFKVIYAKSSDLISSGLTGWNLATKFTIHQGAGEHLHYGDVCHYDNDFKAIGMYVIDPYPPTGSGTENTLYTFNIPTFHYPFVKSALGL